MTIIWTRKFFLFTFANGDFVSTHFLGFHPQDSFPKLLFILLIDSAEDSSEDGWRKHCKSFKGSWIIKDKDWLCCLLLHNYFDVIEREREESFFLCSGWNDEWYKRFFPCSTSKGSSWQKKVSKPKMEALEFFFFAVLLFQPFCFSTLYSGRRLWWQSRRCHRWRTLLRKGRRWTKSKIWITVSNISKEQRNEVVWILHNK